MEHLAPLLRASEQKAKVKVLLGTVRGDLHDIGKNLVGLVLEGSGFEVIDLGVDVPPEEFARVLQEHPDAQVLGMSAMLTTTMGEMGETIKHLSKEGLRDKIKVILGGAVSTEKFAREINADAFAADAVEAKNTIGKLLASPVAGG